MLRRCIWGISSRRAIGGIPRPVVSQVILVLVSGTCNQINWLAKEYGMRVEAWAGECITAGGIVKSLTLKVQKRNLSMEPGSSNSMKAGFLWSSFYLSSRSEFSSGSPKNSTQKPAPAENVSDSRSSISKLILGSVAIGAAALAAYKAGYTFFPVPQEISPPNTTNIDSTKAYEGSVHSVEQAVLPIQEEPNTLEPGNEILEKTDEPQSQEFENKNEAIRKDVPAEGTFTIKQKEQIEDEPKLPSEDTIPVTNEQLTDSELFREGNKSDDTLTHTEVNLEKNGLNEISKENVGVESPTQVSEEVNATEVPMGMTENHVGAVKGPQKSLSESYSLQDEGSLEISTEGVNTVKKLSTSNETSEQLKNNVNSEDEKIVLDLIDAIHAAEKKQAESDASLFAEEKKAMKEKYEKELKDARARALMYAEEAAILDKELSKEKAKAAAAIKSVEEKAANTLREELQRKVEEADMQLMKVQELAKTELAAAIAKEKSSQIEKIAEADLNINALCMAFYARSEEARQTYSVHKLALGTLALEDALSRGLPMQAEVDGLLKLLDGIDKDSLLQLALLSLPEEILNYGTDTLMQLNQKFETLKGTLRHFSLIPAGGGGILTHAVAHVASFIKVKEESSNGIESIISKVENLLIEGNIAEAADVLEGGVRGSEAEEVATEWVRQARNRAIAEQALCLLHSHALSVTFS